MRYIVLAFLPFMALFLQATIFSFYNIGDSIPDMVLIFIIYYALLNGAHKGAVYGFLCGLLEDIYLGRFIGINALAKGLTGFIIGKLQGNVFKENLLVGVLAAAVGTIINAAAMFLFSILSGVMFEVNTLVIHSLLYQCLYNLLLAIPLYAWYYNSSRKGVLRAGGED